MAFQKGFVEVSLEVLAVAAYKFQEGKENDGHT